MKKFLITLVSIISVFCCIIGFTACDDSVNRVTASCVFDNDEMTLPVKFKKAYNGGIYDYFIPTEDCSLEGIKVDVEAMSGNGVNYNCEIYNEDYLLIEKSNGNELHYYLTVRTDRYYYFLSPTANINYNTVLFPYHLTISAEEFERKCGNFIDEAERLSGTREQIKDFYAKTGLFDITEEGNVLKIKLNDDYERPDRFDSFYHTEKQIIITFGADEDGEYAVYTLAEE